MPDRGTAQRVPRELRLQYAGAFYHVMSRGDRREDIFLDDVDRQDFLKTLPEAHTLFDNGWLGVILVSVGAMRS